jgi:putative flippase GtrA
MEEPAKVQFNVPASNPGKSALFGQIVRFAVVGVINTVVDFTVLNLLSWLTGITDGKWIVLLNLVSFSVAVINSWFLNKFWAFKDRQSGDTGKKFSLFLAISIIGAFINSGTVYIITSWIPRPDQFLTGLSDIIPIIGSKLADPKVFWLNIAKAAATGMALVWNFVGYKLIVFKK